MMLQKRKILPNGYFKNPSRKIDFTRYNLRVPVAVEDLIAGDPALGLIVSISSIGIGGAYHVIQSYSRRHQPVIFILLQGACGHTVLREHECRPVLPITETLKLGPFLFAVGTSSLVSAYFYLIHLAVPSRRTHSKVVHDSR